MSDNFTLREATPSDANAIAAIHTASWRATYTDALSASYLENVVPGEREALWQNRLKSPKANQYVVVAELDSKLIGFTCIYADENESWGAYLDNLHVTKAYQSLGVGKALLTHVAHWYRLQNPSTGMYLLVNQDNIKAQHFYTKLGAYNAKEGVWNAPDGSVVPTYWFVWDTLEYL